MKKPYIKIPFLFSIGAEPLQRQPIMQWKELEVDRVRYDEYKASLGKPRKKARRKKK